MWQCKFYIELIAENDIIDHKNKKAPIISSSYYYKSHYYSNSNFLNIEYNFEFIRYENDDGYFFHNSEDFMAVGMSDITHDIENRLIHKNCASIKYSLSEKSSSHYKRSYQKIQSLLADIMSIINILISIGKIIKTFFCQKKWIKILLEVY